MFRKFKARGKLKVMTANPNPAQFLTHGLKAQPRGPERTAGEHPHLLCPSARTHHKEKLRVHEQQQEKQTFSVEDEAQQVKVLVALAEVQYSVSSIHNRLLTTYNSSSRESTPFSGLHRPYIHIHTH